MSDLTFKDIVEEADSSLEKALKNLVSAKIAAAAQSAGEPSKGGLFFPDGIQLIYLSFNVKNIGEVTLAIAGEKAKYPNQPNLGNVLRDSDGPVAIVTTRRLNLRLSNFRANLRATKTNASVVDIVLFCRGAWTIVNDPDKVFKVKCGNHSGGELSDHQKNSVLKFTDPMVFDCLKVAIGTPFQSVSVGQVNNAYKYCDVVVADAEPA